MNEAGHVARMGEERKVYTILVGNPEGKRPLGRPMRRWEDEIRKDLRETGCKGVDWIRLALDRDRWQAVVSAVMNLRVLVPRSYLVFGNIIHRVTEAVRTSATSAYFNVATSQKAVSSSYSPL
jgi:hypothetical protein